jgi:hypothetical protein
MTPLLCFADAKSHLIEDMDIGTTVAPRRRLEGLLFPYSHIILAYFLIYLNLY